jgi:hypothetical protein
MASLSGVAIWNASTPTLMDARTLLRRLLLVLHRKRLRNNL